MENLTITKIIKLLKSNIKIISLFGVAGLIVGILYALLIYKPIYSSTAKLLIQNPQSPIFVTELGQINSITPLTRDGNPALTQITIISSDTIASKVWQEISTKYKFTDPPEVGIKLMQNSITAVNPVGTDIIEITARWQDPKIAQDIANAYVTAYLSQNIDTAKKSIIQSKDAIARQLADAQRSLFDVRNQMRAFRQAYSTVDITTEAQNIVTQTAGIEDRYNDILSQANAEANRAGMLASKLGIDWQKGLNSVAIGYNGTVTQLQQSLGTAQEDYASLASKYTPSHPALAAAIARVNSIKSNLADQIKLTIGNQGDATGIIADPVRSGMLSDLARSEAAYRGFLAQSNILRAELGALNAKKATLPSKQQVLANLTQEEDNWMTIVNTLKSKLVEAIIRESGVVGNASIIDVPALPQVPAFPGRTPVTIMFALLGVAIGILGTMLDYLLKDTYDSTGELEAEFKVPILGAIPWLDKQTYNEPESLLAIDNTSSFYSLAYQKIVSSMRIKGYNSGVKTLVFTSSEFSKSRSTMLMNLAYGLNKAGQSVIVVDADFRTPSLHQEFRLPNEDQYTLDQLITTISGEIQMNGEFNWKSLSNYIQAVPGGHNLYIITNSEKVPDPYEYLHSPAFSLLIKNLKDNYDWVLIDAPPALAVPDAVTIASYSDGVILTVGVDSKKSNLKKVHKLLDDHQLKIFGIIARELQTDEAATSNEYIKQLISRMIPQGSDVFAEK